MIPGTISKVTEGVTPCGDTIKVFNDLVKISGTGTINTIIPGLGIAQGQFLMIVPLDGQIELGSKGNILGNVTISKLRVITLIFSKSLQKWLIAGAIGFEEEEEMETFYIPFNQANFTADNGGTWTVSNQTIYTNLYYVHGRRVTISIVIGFSQIGPANTVRTIRMRLPDAVSNIAKQGPLSNYPNNATGFMGTAIVSPDLANISVAAIPAYCGVTGGPIDTPTFGNLAIALNSGNFPASPTGGFVILATCTYILAE